MGFPPGMVTFASAWQPEATEHEAAQLGVQIAVQFPVDLREAEVSLGHVQFQKSIFSDTKLLTKYALIIFILDLGYQIWNADAASETVPFAA